MGRELRRSYLIKRTFQTKLVLRLGLMILVTSLMVALIFIGSRYYVAVKIGDPRHFDVLDELGGMFFEVLIYWITGYLVLFAYFALRFSHEIAGPLFRFEKAFRAIGEQGDLKSPIRLREEDDPEFHQLAALFNQAQSRVSETVEASREVAAELRALVADAADPATLREGVAHASARLDEALGDLTRPAPVQLEPEAEPPAPQPPPLPGRPDPYFGE
jgi:methyl-accepting chemotaxis protein